MASRTLTRRTLVGGISLGSVASFLPAQTHRRQTAPDSAMTADVTQVRSWMEEREQRIRTAYVDFRPELGRAAQMFERIEIHVRDGVSHVKQHIVGAGVVMVQVIRDRTIYQYTIDPEGNPIDPLTRRASPAEIRSLDGFLPTLSSRPAYRLGRPKRTQGRSLDGQGYEDPVVEEEFLQIAQSDTVFWVDPRTRDVVRFEGYDELAKPIAEFKDFVVRSGVRFPTRVETRQNGELISLLVVDHVAINEYVDPELFEVPAPHLERRTRDRK